jgi:hypothetical protein
MNALKAVAVAAVLLAGCNAQMTWAECQALLSNEQPSQVALLITQKAIMSKQAARLCKEVSNKR